MLRHSGASAVSIGAAVDNGVLALEVTDNGMQKGGPVPGNGHGLIGIRERTTALGGQLRVIGPSPGEFSVHARLPARLDP